MKTQDFERDWISEVEEIQSTFRTRTFTRARPVSEFPELIVTLPDELNTIELAPLYDVHIGSRHHDEKLFDKHLAWIAETPNVFTFNGGDAYENVTDFKMGPTPMNPEEQLLEATKKFGRVQHKMLFSIPGNHEDRTFKHSGMDGAKRLADNLQVPYFGDYCFCSLNWRGNHFHLLAHHGSGAAQTPGAQRNSARKDLAWSKPDIMWSGHLHQTLADTVYLTDYDQKTGRVYERGCAVIISPSYLKYFNSYAAKSRYAPGLRGLSVAILQEDGRIDLNLHARGKRL
jgi:hypothetical protein